MKVSLTPACSAAACCCLSKGLQFGDVRLVELRDMRHRQPAAMQVRAADAPDARQRLFLHLAELAEVHRGCRRQCERQSASGGRRCVGASAQHLFDVGLHVVLDDAALAPAALDLSQVDAEFAREAAYGWTRVRDASARDRGRVRWPRQHGRLAPFGLAGCARGFRLWRCCWRLRCIEFFCRATLVDGVGLRATGRCQHLQDQVTLVELVTDLDQHRLHPARGGAGDLHGGLVAFERDDGLIHVDLIAGRDQDLDHGDVGEVANVGQADLDLCWRCGAAGSGAADDAVSRFRRWFWCRCLWMPIPLVPALLPTLAWAPR
jgi:hypothetical protein